MNSPDTAVVGTYVTEQEAEDARARLREVGIEPVGVTHVSDDAWQVDVPSAHRPQALEELQLMEQHNITDL